MLWFALAQLGCRGPAVCKAALAQVDVVVTSQETGAPVEGATVELDREPCSEDGAGRYTCFTDAGSHQVSVLAGIEYAAQAQSFEIPPYSCVTEPVELDFSLLPSMA